MLLPDVTLVVCTYNRLNEIQRTLQALRDWLIYPDDQVRLLIADDHSPNNYINKLKRTKVIKEWPGVVDFSVTEQNSGWGVNVNTALSHVVTDYVFFIEDDYTLQRTLDLRLGVALLLEKPHVGLVRYRGTAGDVPVFHQFEADVTAHIPEFREYMGLPGKLTYLQFNGGSPTAYIYSHGAHLKHRRFHEYYGLYDEGRKLGETEEAMAVRVKSMMQADPTHAPGIVIFPEFIPMHFDHIGQTYQHTEADK